METQVNHRINKETRYRMGLEALSYVLEAENLAEQSILDRENPPDTYKSGLYLSDEYRTKLQENISMRKRYSSWIDKVLNDGQVNIAEAVSRAQQLRDLAKGK